MSETNTGSADEFLSVVASVSEDFYVQASPASVAGRLAALQIQAWRGILTGATPAPILGELRRQAARLIDADELIDTCNGHIVWALTPAIAASAACGPGCEQISLREIEASLLRLLNETQAPAAELATEERIAA